MRDSVLEISPSHPIYCVLLTVLDLHWTTNSVIVIRVYFSFFFLGDRDNLQESKRYNLVPLQDDKKPRQLTHQVTIPQHGTQVLLVLVVVVVYSVPR